MGRTGNVIVLIVYLLTVPAGVFFYFTTPAMGYPAGAAGIIAAVLALVGLALIPVAIRNRPPWPSPRPRRARPRLRRRGQVSQDRRCPYRSRRPRMTDPPLTSACGTEAFSPTCSVPFGLR